MTNTKIKAGDYTQPLSLVKIDQFNEGDEGGLDLGQILGAIGRGTVLIAGITIMVTSGAILKALNEVPVYRAKFEVLTEPVTAESEIISSVPQTLSSRRTQGSIQSKTGAVDETKIKVLKSPRVLSSVVEKLQVRYPDISYESLIENLSIKTNQPNILEVVFQNPDEELVRDVLDLVSKAYLNYSLEERQAETRQGIRFVEEQLPQLQSRVQNQLQRVQKIQQQNNLVDPAMNGQELAKRISGIEKQQLDNQIQLYEAQVLYGELQRELASSVTESAAISVLSENRRYQTILNRLQELDLEIARELVIFRENSPKMENLREQQKNLRSLLGQEGRRVQKELGTTIRELEARDRVLTQVADSLKQQIRQLSVINREYTNIQRELEIATNNLDQFLAKREALRIDVAQKQVPWQLLAPISDPEPSAASVKTNLALGLILGLLLGLGVAVVVDKANNILYTLKELKDITKLPLLGVIPWQKGMGGFAPTLGKQLQWHKAEYWFELFRSVYTNIRLLSSDQPIGSLVISSVMDAEGKSTVATNLALAAAAMGKQVLLVDTNLRSPSLHDSMGLSNQSGLIDVIANDINVEDVIKSSPLEKNLFVMTAGFTPSDPIRLLASEKMQHLMAKLQATFDLVIYDAPPLVGFADTNLLAVHTDGVVLVARLGKLKSSTLEQALGEFRVSGIPIIGVVANGSKKSNYYR
ncbi:MAG: polysaccharide biosynthesis tyrosine autokinase [Moorea sp. SIOASIH]|uniref:GumC family protein n=1 Tax=Moorena sp. SIOASIH TaxID=2607817 RepID=UPI0013B938E5|nr:tyrosine-protein kinase domain-containing protein [Moorena sp. SIOASIH]NEO36558.1 polysaccharide biosynthesis tyrosine autokinase [Moorena sp. SIOASIH]